MKLQRLNQCLYKSGRLVFLLPLLFVLPSNGQALMEHKLLASDAAQEQFFGSAVSLSGDRLLVGADGQDVQRLRTPGTAYIFERQGNGSWAEVAMFRHEAAAFGDLFGTVAALEGDRAIVGAPLRFSNGVKTGEVFVFERQNDGIWAQVASLLASDGASDDGLGGRSISLSGDRVLIGANAHAHGATASGAAYIFERQSDGTWLETAELLPADIAAFSNVGLSVALDGERAVVGAPFAAYIFELQGENWVEVDKIAPENPQNSFGVSVAVRGDRIAVGANTATVNGILTGTAYIFDRQANGTWTETTELRPDDPTFTQHFGFRVLLSEHRALISSWRDPLMGESVGSAYVFLRSANGKWAQEVKLTASDGGSNDTFGASAAISGNRVVLGASKANDFGSQSGAAYLYDLTPVSVANEQELPQAGGFSLSQPYPNPFYSSTQFSLTVEAPQHIAIEVFNVLGQRIQVLQNGHMPAAAKYDFEFNRKALPAGMYFVRITGEHFAVTRLITRMR